MRTTSDNGISIRTWRTSCWSSLQPGCWLRIRNRKSTLYNSTFILHKVWATHNSNKAGKIGIILIYVDKIQDYTYIYIYIYIITFVKLKQFEFLTWQKLLPLLPLGWALFQLCGNKIPFHYIYIYICISLMMHLLIGLIAYQVLSD